MVPLLLTSLLAMGTTRADADLAIHLAHLRLGGTGVSWTAGPTVDFQLKPRVGLGGGLLLVGDGYLGAHLETSACLHARRFEKGWYGRLGLGGTWLAMTGRWSGSAQASLGPAYRIPLRRPEDGGAWPLLDLGAAVTGEAALGRGALGEGGIGLMLRISGGLGT